MVQKIIKEQNVIVKRQEYLQFPERNTISIACTFHVMTFRRDFFSYLHDMDIVATALPFLARSPAFWPKLKKNIEKLISYTFIEIEISTNMFLKVQKRKINLFT